MSHYIKSLFVVAVHTFYFFIIMSLLVIPKLLGQSRPGQLCAAAGAALQCVDQLETEEH